MSPEWIFQILFTLHTVGATMLNSITSQQRIYQMAFPWAFNMIDLQHGVLPSKLHMITMRKVEQPMLPLEAMYDRTRSSNLGNTERPLTLVVAVRGARHRTAAF